MFCWYFLGICLRSSLVNFSGISAVFLVGFCMLFSSWLVYLLKLLDFFDVLGGSFFSFFSGI